MPTILKQRLAISFFASHEISENFQFIIKMSGSESWGQEEAACMHVFRPMQPLQWVIYMYHQSKFLKCCSSAAITAIT